MAMTGNWYPSNNQLKNQESTLQQQETEFFQQLMNLEEEPTPHKFSAPDSTLISACSDIEQRSQLACTQPPDARKLGHQK